MLLQLSAFILLLFCISLNIPQCHICSTHFPLLSHFCAVVSKAFFLIPFTMLLHSHSQLWAALQVPLALPVSPGLGQVPDHCLHAPCSLDVSISHSQPVCVVAWRVPNKLTWTRVWWFAQDDYWYLGGGGPFPLAWHLCYPSACQLGELIRAE